MSMGRDDERALLTVFGRLPRVMQAWVLELGRDLIKIDEPDRAFDSVEDLTRRLAVEVANFRVGRAQVPEREEVPRAPYSDKQRCEFEDCVLPKGHGAHHYTDKWQAQPKALDPKAFRFSVPQEPVKFADDPVPAMKQAVHVAPYCSNQCGKPCATACFLNVPVKTPAGTVCYDFCGQHCNDRFAERVGERMQQLRDAASGLGG